MLTKNGKMTKEEIENLQLGDKIWMSTYSGMGSEYSEKNMHLPTRFDVQQIKYKRKYISNQLLDNAVLCEWKKADNMVISVSSLEKSASFNEIEARTQAFINFFNNPNYPYYSEEEKRFSSKEQLQFKECKNSYPELFVKYL